MVSAAIVGTQRDGPPEQFLGSSPIPLVLHFHVCDSGDGFNEAVIKLQRLISGSPRAESRILALDHAPVRQPLVCVRYPGPCRRKTRIFSDRLLKVLPALRQVFLPALLPQITALPIGLVSLW